MPWFRNRAREDTPRAWAQLTTLGGRQLRFHVSHKAGVTKTAAPTGPDREILTQPDSRDTSLAMAPDGTLVAALAGRTLDVSFVSADAAGDLYPWRTVRLPSCQHPPRVLAVARKGHTDAWLALSSLRLDDEDEVGGEVRTDVYVLSLSQLGEAVQNRGPRERGYQGSGGKCTLSELLEKYRVQAPEGDDDRFVNGGADPYASFVGRTLLVVDVKGSVLRLAAPVSNDPSLRASIWRPAHEELRQNSAVAIDSVRIQGRDYVVLLVRDEQPGRRTDSGSESVTRLVVGAVSEEVEWKESTLPFPALHLSVVRGLDGDASGLRVLCGTGSIFQAIELFRDVRPDGESGSGGDRFSDDRPQVGSEVVLRAGSQ